MSIKRQATTDLNHDNWDHEEPTEQSQMGPFKTASRDVLEKRVIRTAKRRAPISSNDETKKSVFHNTKLGDFNKPLPTSFDFLANLTNHNKNTNGSTSETPVSSSLFGSKLPSSSGGLFGNKSAANTPKSTQGTLFTSTSPFGISEKTSSPSLFTASKADSTVNESPFKMQAVSSTADSNSTKVASPTPQITSNMFGVSPTASNDGKPFTSTNSTPFKLQMVSSTTTTMVQTTFGTTTNTAVPATTEKKDEDKHNEKKMKYYAKLKGLNESVSDWISKHVAKTPLCILSPIFKDYEKYLKEIMEEYQVPEKSEVNKKIENKAPEANTENVPKSTTLFGSNMTGSPFSSASNSAAKPPVFGSPSNETSKDNKQPTFSFGIKTSPSNASNTTTSPGFSFGVTTTSSITSSPFTLTTSNTTPNSTPFSFGVGKPFSFSPNNIQQNVEPSKQDTSADNEDEPPKVEYTPVKEDNSVFEMTCKIFVKNGDSFADKGVGTLYVKNIKESGKHQLLVRANTNLGTILLNLLLSSSVPMQRAGKNNVMLVCIPTPDAKPPPTPVLIRVKTAEGADELLETLKKYTT